MAEQQTESENGGGVATSNNTLSISPMLMCWWADPKQAEWYKVYKRANPTGEPAERPIWLAATYYAALAAFSTIEQAGPNLNPVSFMGACTVS